MNYFYQLYNWYFIGENPGGAVAKVLDCDIVVREFELQSRCYTHFRTNITGKGPSG